MPRPKKPPPEKLVRRPKSERKGLAPEFESLARGDTDRLYIPIRQDPERVRDPRDGYAVKGVANRDARAVYDARIARLHVLLGEPEAPARDATLEDELCDWVRLQLWRARRVTTFRSFAEDVLGASEEALAAFSQRGSERLGVTLEPVSERSLALWLRLEAGLLEADESAWARLDAAGRFLFSVALDPAPAAIAAASVRVSPMSRDKRASPGGREQRGERTGRERPFVGARGGEGERRERSSNDTRGKGGDRPPRRQTDDARPQGASQERPARSQGASQERPARAPRSGFGERRPRKDNGRG